MRRTVRCWLGTAGAAAAAAWVLGQGGVASAAPAAGAARSGPARVSAQVYVPPHGYLYPGLHSTAVRDLQRRLDQLHYYPGPVNGTFDADTLEAVWAFKEVQGIPAVVAPDDVGIVAARALVKPRLPLVMVRGGGSERVEVNLTSEVLVLYRGGRVELISHISAGGGYYYPCPGGGTCGPAITPDGNYRARWFAGGWVQVPLGYMYDPVFFIGGAYAIHGDIPVPLQPVSHGCVRIPMDVAAFFHTLVHASESDGTPVYVRGRAPGT
jgi:peptidoglycan hydrolase-like protein with peptidoglycan-binding domain